MTLKRVCVVGAGTIGSLCAAHLGAVAEVSVLTRRPEHAEALREEGLRVSGRTERHVRVRASHDAGDLGDADLVVVACKATQLDEVAARLEGRFASATMMTIQNGLGVEETLVRHGPWPVISAVTFMSGTRHGDTHVEYELDTATWMGPYAGTGTPFSTVAETCRLFVASGLQAEAMPDLVPAQWSKLVFNSAVNSVAALTGLPHVEEYVREEALTDLGHVVRALVDEGVGVARALGVALHEDPWEMNLRAVAQGETARAAYAHLPSMLEDVLARRPTEVDAICGALVRKAGEAGVPAPLTAAVYRLVKAKESSWRRPAPAGVAAAGLAGGATA
ncbi:MAG: ketopantoate reductase family protein [Acidimicrobiales bacterium]